MSENDNKLLKTIKGCTITITDQMEKRWKVVEVSDIEEIFKNLVKEQADLAILASSQMSDKLKTLQQELEDVKKESRQHLGWYRLTLKKLGEVSAMKNELQKTIRLDES